MITEPVSVGEPRALGLTQPYRNWYDCAMTVYTHRQRVLYTHRPRVYLPWWSLVFVLPAYMLYLSIVLVAALFVGALRVSVAMWGALATLAAREAGRHVVK